MQKLASSIHKIFKNPALGLLPYFSLSFLLGFANVYVAFGISMLIALAPRIFQMKKENCILYDISICSLLVSFLGFVFLIPDFSPSYIFILAEISLLFSLMLFRISRGALLKRVASAKLGERKFYIYESFQIAFQTQYALTFHLILLLGYIVYFEIESPVANVLLILNLFQIVVAVIILLEGIRLKLLRERLNREEWLPVINESGTVQGKVAKSVSLNLKNRFLHPLIRIALIYDGKIFLRERESSRVLDPGKLDYPFEKYMHYNHNIDVAIKNLLKSVVRGGDLPVRFILKYMFENERTKRLIFLYISVIKSEDELNKLYLKEGKLWTVEQIEDNIGSGIFSECFELEFEYLRNTVLMTNF